MKYSVSSNFLKVQQQNVVSHIQAFVQNAPDTSITLDTRFSDRAKQALEGGKPDYSKAIRYLNQQRDFNNGITWHINTNQQILVRDARNATSPAQYGYEAYAMQYLNTVRATKTLLEKEGKLTAEVEQRLDFMAKKFLEKVSSPRYPNTEKASIKAVKEANKELLDFYCKETGTSEKTARKQINTAKDFANFEDTHYHVATLSNIQHNGQTHTVFEADVKLSWLTQEQLAQYQEIKDYKTDPANHPLPDWYQALPAWEKKLVDHYADQITDGKHIIPTQLRSNTVGLRNGYNKVTGIIGNNNAEILHQTLHSGTVAGQTKGDNQAIADMNVRQLAELAGKPVHCVTLNTPHNPTGNDKAIVTKTARATENTGNSHSNFAFNALRRFGPNKYDGAKELLASIAKSAPNDDIKKYLKGKGSSFNRAMEAIDSLPPTTTDDTKTTLKMALELRYLINHNKNPFDRENRNLKITSLVSRISDKIQRNAYIQADVTKFFDKTDASATVFMCQSGKDRTGVQLFGTTTDVIGAKLGISDTPQAMHNLRQAIANNGHTQQMAGFQGGSIGCMGIKAESISGMPKSWGKEVQHSISQKTASFNTFKLAEEPGIFARFVNAVKRFFGVGMTEVKQVVLLEEENSLASPENTPAMAPFEEIAKGVEDTRYTGREQRQKENGPLREMMDGFPPEDRKEMREEISKSGKANIQHPAEAEVIKKNISGIEKSAQGQKSQGKA